MVIPFQLEESPMKDQATDQPVLDHIQTLVAEEHRLYVHRSLNDSDRERLAKIEVELDQCWDLLRRRRALRDVGLDPNEAQVRPPGVVEKYEQ
jgi:hypothetical protein